jgi:hypothetical protein
MSKPQWPLVVTILMAMVVPGVSAPRVETTSIALNQQLPRLGQIATFSTTYPKKMEHYQPRIQVLCYQTGELVYAASGTTDHVFVLGGAASQWLTNGGPAECVAEMYYLYETSTTSGGSSAQLTYGASTTFHAEGAE